MRAPRLLLPIGLALGAVLSSGPGAEGLEETKPAGQCAEIYDWVVTYVESFRGHLLRIVVRDPRSSEALPLVGYWITFPENWVKAPRHPNPIVRGCQDTPGGPYTVEVQTEKGDWVAGSRLLVKKLSPDWGRSPLPSLRIPMIPLRLSLNASSRFRSKAGVAFRLQWDRTHRPW